MFPPTSWYAATAFTSLSAPTLTPLSTSIEIGILQLSEPTMSGVQVKYVLHSTFKLNIESGTTEDTTVLLISL